MNTQTITTGSRNSVSSVENAIANVLLYASGLNSRPSRSPRKKIGRNDVTMISIENSSGFVIVAVASMIVASFSRWFNTWSSRAMTFSATSVFIATLLAIV